MRDLIHEDTAKSKFCPKIMKNCIASLCLFWHKDVSVPMKLEFGNPVYTSVKENHGRCTI